MKQVRNAYNEVTEFSNRGWANDGNFNFTCGVLETILINALEDLPKKKREVYLDRLKQIDSKFFVKGQMK